jgi:hypothetical protein
VIFFTHPGFTLTLATAKRSFSDTSPSVTFQDNEASSGVSDTSIWPNIDREPIAKTLLLAILSTLESRVIENSA